MAAKKDSADKPKKKSGASFSVKFSIFSMLVASIVFFQTTILFVVCMIPTFVAGVIDRQPHKTLWITIGSMNLAGTIPSWFALWQAGHHIDDSLSLISQPMTLVMAYGGAAAGWVIHQNITPLVASMMVRKNENRLKDIEKRQKELIRKWGPGVSG